MHHEHVEWFKTLPLYLDLDGLRVVHACWHRPSLDMLEPYLDDDNRILKAAWPALARKGAPGYEALETLIKGLEIPLPAGNEFLDKDRNPRSNIRTRCWVLEGVTYRDLAMVPAAAIEQIPHEPIPEDVLPGYDGDNPLFVGHYWLTGTPQRLTPQIACLDYSIASSHAHSGGHGNLCAYRWEGEQKLDDDRLVWVEGQ